MKHEHQRGPLTGRFERRYGTAGFPLPGGMNTQMDPATIPVNQFRLLVNALLRGNEVRERGGSSTFGAFGSTGVPCTYPMNFDLSTPKRVWMVGDGCASESTALGFNCSHYDSEQEPRHQRATYYPDAIGCHIGNYGGVPYLGVVVGGTTTLRRMNLVQVPFGVENIVLAGTSQSVPIETFSGFVATFLIEFDGLLFVGLDGGAGASKIITWDGRTIRNDITGIDAPLTAGLWRDSLVVGFGSTTNHIRVRARGGSPGTWVTVAPGAGTVAGFAGLNSVASYKDKVYMADGAANVWGYDGTTLAIARTVAGAAVESVCEAFGYLFYGYMSSAGKAILGRFDGTTWVDVHKDFTVVSPASTKVRGLVYHKSGLVAGVNKTGVDAFIWRSPQENTAGVWEAISTGGLGITFTAADIRYFVVI